MSNSHVVLKSRPGVDGEPTEGNFGCLECPMPSDTLDQGNVLIKTCYLSVDPALRCMMNEDPGVTYLKGWQVDQPIIGLNGLGVVVKSNHPQFSPGDIIQASMKWPWKKYFQQYIEENDTNWSKVDPMLASNLTLPLHLLVGLTSLVGLWEKGHVTQVGNQTLVVSGAAGACGSIAGQVGKIEGCSNVVGICGSKQKCEWIVKDLGFTSAINYKTGSVSEELTKLCPNGIDIYFDNVGGEISSAVISQMNRNSNVVLCGQISQYNKDVPYPPPLDENISDILKERNITRERFTIVNYPHRFEEASKCFISMVLSGKMKVRETITQGLSNTGEAFVSMMRGGNMGKQLVHVADP